jgi:hypothetical protein
LANPLRDSVPANRLGFFWRWKIGEDFMAGARRGYKLDKVRRKLLLACAYNRQRKLRIAMIHAACWLAPYPLVLRQSKKNRIGFTPGLFRGEPIGRAGNELGTGTEVRGAQSLFPPELLREYLISLAKPSR